MQMSENKIAALLIATLIVFACKSPVSLGVAIAAPIPALIRVNITRSPGEYTQFC
jgi:hypothetical protein